MKIVELQAETILAGTDLILIDVGAAYGLPGHLLALERIARVCYFEPTPDAAQSLRDDLARRGLTRSRVFTEGLSDSDDERILYLTNAPTGSSLLKPGGPFFEEFDNSAYFFPMREVPIPTRALASVLGDAGMSRFDGMKIDVQGAELMVLKGAGAMLAQAQSVEMEIGFPGGYLDQPGFGEIDAFMRAAGFVLFDLRVANFHRDHKGDFDHYPRLFGVDENSPSLTRRISEADAVYFRRADALAAAGDIDAVGRAIVLRCAYGFFPDALDLADRALAANLVNCTGHAKLRQAVITWQQRTQDVLLERPWMTKVLRKALRIWRGLQRRLLGRHFLRWRP